MSVKVDMSVMDDVWSCKLGGNLSEHTLADSLSSPMTSLIIGQMADHVA